MNKLCQEILRELESQDKIKVWKDFEFPPKQELKLKLKDMLENEVDEKYYLSNEQVDRIKASNYIQNQRRIQEKDYCDTLCARDWKDPKCIQVVDYRYDEGLRIRKNELSPCLTTKIGSTSLSGNTLIIKNATKKGYLEAYEGDGVYTNPTTKRGTVQHEMIQTLTTFQDKGVVVKNKK